MAQNSIRSGLIFIDFKDNLRETMTRRFPNKKRTEIPSILLESTRYKSAYFLVYLKQVYFWQLCSENLAGNLLLVCTLSTLFL